jgi:hypothetical protein
VKFWLLIANASRCLLVDDGCDEVVEIATCKGKHTIIYVPKNCIGCSNIVQDLAKFYDGLTADPGQRYG